MVEFSGSGAHALTCLDRNRAAGNIIEYRGTRGGAEAEVVRENFQAEGLSAGDCFFLGEAKLTRGHLWRDRLICPSRAA